MRIPNYTYNRLLNIIYRLKYQRDSTSSKEERAKINKVIHNYQKWLNRLYKLSSQRKKSDS